MYILYKTKRIRYKCQCNNEKNKYKFIEMFFSQNTKQYKMKGIK